ncbi:MAG: TolC family protein, partial [Gemmatimonadetes bacterium]|nr:TolC family protein [Gemmatimonadota bacterium]NIQ58598.1 TolC family protein [Gemmatimonadota bacterium]NIU78788.1 TolC family protein [Gammaproteobacteria bacterium]NIX47601.1 TolC family protein [Gemmatimonadota bacterium]NIY11960.1 TolC family protein [Gemmatimonadota bacterium]
MKRTSIATAGLLLVAGALGAQEAPATLTLEEAIALARENNPDYRSRLNDEAVADWQVRSAYADFLPRATAGGAVTYQGGGEARIGAYTSDDIGIGETPSYYYSSYSLDVSLGLSGAKFYQLGRERASRRAVLANLDVAEQQLDAAVTRQYLAVLRVRDGVDLARSELERAEANLALAEARFAVEAATAIETKQAEVERGRAEVNLLRAQTQLENEKVRLLEQIGVDLDGDVELTTAVRVFEPRWDQASLVATAVASQPELAAAQASAESAEAGVGVARSAFWPSLSLSTGLSGYTRRVGSNQYLIDQAELSASQSYDQCVVFNRIFAGADPPLPTVDCAEQFAFTEADRAALLDQNSQFPFDFTREPASLTLGISLPIFQGLSRQRQLEAAHAEAEDARLRHRAARLRVEADVETAYRELE